MKVALVVMVWLQEMLEHFDQLGCHIDLIFEVLG